MFNAAKRKDIPTSSVRTLKISHPNNRDNDSIVLKIDDDTGQVAVTDTSHRGVSTGFVSKDQLVNEIVKHYYIRKNGFSPYDYEQAIGMFDFLGKQTLSEQEIRYGSISMHYEKVDGLIKIDGVPGFCETHKVSLKHFSDFNDTAEVNKAFKSLKSDVFEDANNRKIQLNICYLLIVLCVAIIVGGMLAPIISGR